MSAVVIGDPHTIGDRAGLLSNAAASLNGVTDQLRTAHSAMNAAGDNHAAESIRSKILDIVRVLENAQHYLSLASGDLAWLKAELVTIDGEAAQLRAQIGSHPDALTSIMHAGQLLQLDHLRSRSMSIREQVAHRLADYATKTIRMTTYHPGPSVWSQIGEFGSEFVGNAETFAKDVGHELVGVARGVGGLIQWSFVTSSANYFIDRPGFEKAWRDTIHTGQAIVDQFHHDVWATARAMGAAVINVDLWKKDPAAWIATSALFFLPGVAGLRGVKVADTVASVGEKLAGAAERLNAAGFTRFLRGTETAAELGENGRLISQSAILRDKLLTIPKDVLAKLEHVWDLQPQGRDGRGFAVERILAELRKIEVPGTRYLEETTANHPTIDLFNDRTGVMTSIKTIDPAAASYNPAGGFRATMENYFRELQFDAKSVDGVPIGPDAVTGRELLLGIPDSGLTQGQVEVLETLTTKYPSVTLHVVEIPR